MEITLNALKSLLGTNPNVIDIRENYLYVRGHFPNAKNIPSRMLKTMPNQYLDKNQTYYLICESGFKSKVLAEKLNTLGYHVYSVKDGYEAI